MPAFSHAGFLPGRQSYQIQPCQISRQTASMTYRTSPRMAIVLDNQLPYRTIKAGPPFSHAESLPGCQSYQIQPCQISPQTASMTCQTSPRMATVPDNQQPYRTIKTGPPLPNNTYPAFLIFQDMLSKLKMTSHMPP
ncbi:hypothetical protein LguiA_012958 [Lonicera macranthoides]